MVRLFPDVPADHPAMGAMILNLSANALGLGNAATPFGIRAMQELDKLNSQPGTATNAMVLFLAINTSSVTLLPTGVIALRAAAGSADPAAILPTTLLATIGSTTVAILAARLYSRLSAAPPPLAPGSSPVAMPDADADPALAEDRPLPLWASVLALATLVSLVPVAVLYGQALSPWIIPGLMVLFLGFGALRRVRVYEVMVEGGREGFQVALRIIPYMVVILVGVAMLRASGVLDLVVDALGRFTAPLGLPAEALPMALMRPLSGSGAYGIVASLLNDPAIGPDSYTGLLISTLQGSTETTFYVLAVYFGAVQVKRLRHAMAAALTADLAGVVFAVLACLVLFGR
jgi:spore maturation protein SpmB